MTIRNQQNATDEPNTRATHKMSGVARHLASLALAGVALTAQADSLLYACDTERDRLVIAAIFEGDEGELSYCHRRLLERVGAAFETIKPWDHVTTAPDGEHITAVSANQRRCDLRNRSYQITFEPRPGNYNVQGRCGAAFGTKVAILDQQREVFSATFGDVDACWNGSTLVTKRVEIGSDGIPVLKQADIDENLFLDFASPNEWPYASGLASLEYKVCEQGSGSSWEYAARERDAEALTLLITEAERTRYWGDALSVAVRERDGELLERLLAAGADPNVRPSFQTPLQEAVCTPGGEQLVDSLLRHGAANSIGDFGEDALFQAISCDKPAAVDMLLARGAKLDVRHVQPLIARVDDTALANGFSLLIQHGLSPNTRASSTQAKLKQRIAEDGSVVVEIGPGTPVIETVEWSLLALAKAHGKSKLEGVLRAAGAKE